MIDYLNYLQKECSDMHSASKALSSISDDHLIECLLMAVEMELDFEFVLQLRGEVNRRNLGSLFDKTKLKMIPRNSFEFQPSGLGI